MKKKIALLSAIGVAGGLLYTLESRHKRNKAKAQKDADNESAVSENGQSVSEAKQNGTGQPKAAASMARIEDGEPALRSEDEHVIDDQGTDQAGLPGSL